MRTDGADILRVRDLRLTPDIGFVTRLVNGI
jgi:hypothetical protein